MQVMLNHLITKDDQTEDTEYHKRIRKHLKEPIQTADDRELTPAEVKNAIEDLASKEAPGEDGITGAIYKRVYELFRTFTYAIYNECLRTGCFPKKCKTAKIIPITKPVKIQTNMSNKCGRQSSRENTHQQN